MAVKIRLARRGRKQHPFYHIVVADARSPRDGKFIEKIGSYNPQTVPATIELDREKAYDWIKKGAQPTDTVNAILKFKGVLYRKHLERGVAKGAFSQEVASKMLEDWIATKEGRIEARKEKTKAEKENFHKLVSGDIKAKPVVAAPVEEQAAFRVDDSTANVETSVEEAAAEAEETVVAEETGAVEETGAGVDE